MQRHHEHVASGTSAGARPGAPERVVYLDNLKVVLIAAIIAIHGVLGYTDTGWWSYGDAREVTLSSFATVALMTVAGPFGLLVIPLLFLVAGLLTPASLDRKGPGRFALDRLVRLGVPFALYVLLIQPPVVYGVDHRWGNASGSYWSEFLGSDGQPDTGPLWFVGVLLGYSLVYAGWAAVRPADPRARRAGDVTAARLGVVAAALVVPTFLVRLAWPLGSESLGDLNFWEWPTCMTLFGLGVVAARQGWARSVPRRLRTQCRDVTLLAAVWLMTLAGLVIGVLGLEGDEMFGGAHWAALGFAAGECVIAVFGAVWVLGVAQGFDRSYRWTRPLAPAAYGAFILQTPVLLGTAVAIRPLHTIAELKAVLVAAVGVLAAFALARLLRRVPGLSRVL